MSFFFQQVRTGDLGGYATSDEFTQAVIANLAVWALFAHLSAAEAHVRTLTS